MAWGLRTGARSERSIDLIGIEASRTGHLVFSTLHANSAAETVARLLDLGVDPAGFSGSFLAVLAQRLLRTLCPACKQGYEACSEEYELLVRHYGAEHFPELGVKRKGLTLYQAPGCEACGGTGYRGRTGIHELLTSSEDMKSLISRKASAAEIQSLAVTEGMRTLRQDGIAKVLKGQSDIEQLRRVTAD